MENKNLGYVRLWRKIASNPIWLQEPFTKGQAWVDLFMLANHKEGFITIRGNVVTLKRGQLGWSEEKLGERWKWSRGKVKRYLKWLETIQQIRQQKSYIISLITILNYETYQSNNTADDTSDDTTDGHQTIQQTDTNKNVKNIKNDNISANAQTNLKPMEEITYEDLEAKIPKKYAGKSKLYKEVVLYYMDLLGKTGNALAFYPAMKEIYGLYLKDFPDDTDEEIAKEIKARIDIAYRHYEKAKCKDWGLKKIAENWNLILTWK